MRYMGWMVVLIMWIGLVNGYGISRWYKGYRFDAKVITDKHGYSREYYKHSRKYIKVREGDEYSILIKNPLPVRVGVAVSVDGLNVISGKRQKASESTKWILEPYQSMTIKGWQTGKRHLRRFYFTDKRNSYAKWKERYDGKHYTRNLGVIGVAYFWDSRALADALRPPQAFVGEQEKCEDAGLRSQSSRKRYKYKAEKKAGTGMGRKRYNSVKRVHFHFDTGMYANRDALKIYYEFGRRNYPQPFADDNDGFAPDMKRIIRKIFGKKHHSGRSWGQNRKLNRLEKLEIMAHLRNLQRLVHLYRAEHQVYPLRLSKLVQSGYVTSIPSAIKGDWVYNAWSGWVNHSLI